MMLIANIASVLVLCSLLNKSEWSCIWNSWQNININSESTDLHHCVHYTWIGRMLTCGNLWNHCHCGTIADIKPLRFQRKMFHQWKQRENTFRKQSRTNNGDFSLPWSPHQGYDDQKRVPTHIKPAQQVKPIIFFPHKGLMRKTQFLAFFK